MKMKLSIISILFLLFIPVLLSAQLTQKDLEMVYKIKKEGKSNSQIEDLSFWFTDFLGPRLTASKGKLRANEWVKEKMESLGFTNIKIEEVRAFDRGGWDNKYTYVAMTEPYYTNFSATPVAWTGSTNGILSGQPILLDIKEEADFEKYKGQLQGKIVLMSAFMPSNNEVVFEPLATRFTDEDLERLQEETIETQGRRNNFNSEQFRQMRIFRQKITEFLKTENVAAILNGNGIFNLPRSMGVNYKSGNPEPIPEINLPIEAHGRIERLLKHQVAVNLDLNIQNEFSESPMVTNVVGEIPGTDPKLKNQVVLIGAHLDSWHGGTGAADNASGCIVMMEAMRILKALNFQPRRTIRIALWGGEEQGLHGSSGYIDKYLLNSKKEFTNEYHNFMVYFNMDNGTGKFRGVYLQENEMIRPIFQEWMKPFNDMGLKTLAIRNTGGSDHVAFNRIGLPSFQFIQDRIEYSRGYHTNIDTYERLQMDDLKHNAIVIASFAYFASMTDKMLPKKPYEIPEQSQSPR